MNPDEGILAPGYSQARYTTITQVFPVTCANKFIILPVLELDSYHLQWKLSVPTQSYHINDIEDKVPSHTKTLHLILLFKKSVENKFIFKQRCSNCLTGSKVCVEDSHETNYGEIRKHVPGAWPAPYFFKVTLYSVLYIEIL